MSEERKLILQMVAEGKITPEEADKLLQALEESERTANATATEQAHREENTAGSEDLGTVINRAVGDSMKALERTLRDMEIGLDRKLNDPANQQLFVRIEEKMRRSAERAVERAQQAEERARRIAERAEERAREQMRRAEEHARRFEERARTHADRWGAGIIHFGEGVRESAKIVKFGVCIDKVSVERTKEFALPAQAGDTFHLENRVGNVRVEFVDANQAEVTVKGLFWGEDENDANERAEAFRLDLVRNGADVVMSVARPSISATGFVNLKESRLDYTVRLPQGMHVNVRNKVGDLVVVSAGKAGQWHLLTKVGDVDVKVAPEAGFTYDLSTNVGAVRMAVADDQPSQDDHSSKGGFRTGRVGDGSGRIEVSVKTGDIRVIN
ncbi:MAG TPA: DUF4097 family beta strand repeat-containing protein [Symbiobacteriaceae bacterium]|nr:DUF4097 family beta strand repeat-containing protein [Symbiobacteriaceae bacterium]